MRRGQHHTEEARRRISQRLRGIERGPDTLAHHEARCRAQQARRAREQREGKCTRMG
jgi:hypothetical protein